MAQILDGNRVRDEIKSELKPRVGALAAAGRPPGLAVVLAGNNPASEIYVRNKIKACHDLGIYSESITPADRVGRAWARRQIRRNPLNRPIGMTLPQGTPGCGRGRRRRPGFRAGRRPSEDPADSPTAPGASFR